MEFGVLGTAAIAREAVLPAIAASDHSVGAVASRDGGRAREFARAVGAPAHYEGYGALLAEADVDAVYIPLPNALHAEWTTRAADAGFDVLCEKPLAVDADQARDVVGHCRDRGVTLMEAFMYRYHPRTERAIDLAGQVGEVRSVAATFDWPVADPADVRLSPELAGGSLMDVGCYAVSAARQLLGEPAAAVAHATDSRGAGVETDLSGLLITDDGRTARVSAGFDTRVLERYRVEGTDGWIEVENAFVPPAEASTELSYRIGDRTVTETFDPVDQYRREIEAFARAVASGTSPRTDGAEAVANMAAIDALYESARLGERVPVER